MQFTFSRRSWEFGVFRNRIENPGSDKKHKAIDLPFRMALKPRDLDMLIPAQGVRFSEFLLGSNLRKPALQTSVLPKVLIARTPTILLTIFDSPADKRKHMSFEDVLVKSLYIEVESDGSLWLHGLVKILPAKNDLQRINDKVEDQTLECECKESQPELEFEETAAADDDQGDGTEGQADLMEDPDGEDEEEEEDDDE